MRVCGANSFFTRYDTAATSFAQQVGRLMATTFRTFVLRAFRYAFHALVDLFVERKAVWLAVRAVLGEFLDEEYSDDLFFNKYIAMLCTGHDCTIDERGDLQLLASPAPTDNEGKIVSASGRDTITALKKVNMLLLIYRVSSFYFSLRRSRSLSHAAFSIHVCNQCKMSGHFPPFQSTHALLKR